MSGEVERQPILAVVGSINYDRTVRVPAHPAPGETVIAHTTQEGLGGKGANQALAAAAADARVVFVGAVGNDASGATLTTTLRKHGVDTAQISVTAGPSGTAFVVLDPAGENIIYVVPGANATVGAKDVAVALRRSISAGDIVLCQGELPVEALVAAASTARELGARFVLNLAPVMPVSPEVLRAADPLILNEVEAVATFLHVVGNAPAPAAGRSPVELAHELATALSEHAGSVVITLGGDGAVVAEHGRTQYLPAEHVPEVVDTSGAGDAFVGAAAAALLAGAPLEDAVLRGVGAGTAAVRRSGANHSHWDEHDPAPKVGS